MHHHTQVVSSRAVQSLAPKAWPLLMLHTLSSLLWAPCCCQSTYKAVGPPTQPESTALERTIPEGKKGCSSKRLSSAWQRAFPALGFADSLCLCRLQNHRDLLLDILPLAAGLAPVLRSAELCLEMLEDLQRVEITRPLWAAQCIALRVNQACPPAWPGAPKLEFVAIAPAPSPAATRRCLAPSL